LDPKCKSYERNRKQKMKKRKEEKNRKGPRSIPFGLVPEAACGPSRGFPNQYVPPFSSD
jgi:hypothetical protein